MACGGYGFGVDTKLLQCELVRARSFAARKDDVKIRRRFVA
jgi:hypothetical protein